MATLQVVSVTPNDHVLPVTAAIQIRFSRNDTTFNNVRVRVCKNGSVTSGNVAVIDVTSSTTFNGADGRTVLTYGKLTSQGGVEEGVTYSLDITCFDTAPTVLDWTPVTTFAPYRRPTISSFVPAINAELDGYPIECSWVIDPGGADGVLKSQTLEITDITDAAAPSRVYYSEIDPALREVALTIADVQLSSDRSYRFTLRPVNDVGLMAVLYHDTTTHWEPPLEPSATVEVDEDALGATITVHAGEDVSDWLIKFVGTDAVVRDGYLTISGTDAVINASYTVADGNIQFDSPSAPATQSLMLVRINQDGTRWVIATGLTSGEVVKDPLPPLGVEYQYEVTAVDANGSTNVSAVSMTISSRYWLLNFGNDASEYVRLIGNPKASRSMKHGGAAYHFADGGEGGGLPVWYGTTDRDYSGSWSFDEVGPDVADDLFAKCDQWPVCWMRDPFGRRRRAHVEPREGHAKGLLWQVSVDYDEMRFREAW